MVYVLALARPKLIISSLGGAFPFWRGKACFGLAKQDARRDLAFIGQRRTSGRGLVGPARDPGPTMASWAGPLAFVAGTASGPRQRC